MTNRQEVQNRLVIEGRPFLVNLIANPTIDDVVITEMRLHAHEISSGQTDPDRRVSRDIRDFLIRIGVER